MIRERIYGIDVTYYLCDIDECGYYKAKMASTFTDS